MAKPDEQEPVFKTAQQRAAWVAAYHTVLVKSDNHDARMTADDMLEQMQERSLYADCDTMLEGVLSALNMELVAAAKRPEPAAYVRGLAFAASVVRAAQDEVA